VYTTGVHTPLAKKRKGKIRETDRRLSAAGKWTSFISLTHSSFSMNSRKWRDNYTRKKDRKGGGTCGPTAAGKWREFTSCAHSHFSSPIADADRSC